MVKRKVRGFGFRIAGLVLGILATTLGVLSIVFSGVGLHQARLCKHCSKGADFK